MDASRRDDNSEGDSGIVTYNNQNSILMAMKIPDTLCLLHDNRIYGFRHRNDSSVEEQQDLILSLLTTAKFRIMGFLYSGYHLLDNTLFLLIIILSALNNGFTLPTHHEMALFGAIGLEGFYDVMLYTHRYWVLQRLSIYIGAVLYFAYFLIVGLMSAYGITSETQHEMIVWCVLGTRFGAFILEELVDIAIDLELHNDLVKLNRERLQRLVPERLNPDDNADGGNDIEMIIENPAPRGWTKYLDVSNSVLMPNEVEYLGSFFAWGQKSVFNRNVWKRDPFMPVSTILLCFLPTIPAVLVFIPILILCMTAGIVILILFNFLAIFTCNFKNVWSRAYWNELLHI